MVWTLENKWKKYWEYKHNREEFPLHIKKTVSMETMVCIYYVGVFPHRRNWTRKAAHMLWDLECNWILLKIIQCETLNSMHPWWQLIIIYNNNCKFYDLSCNCTLNSKFLFMCEHWTAFPWRLIKTRSCKMLHHWLQSSTILVWCTNGELKVAFHMNLITK